MNDMIGVGTTLAVLKMTACKSTIEGQSSRVAILLGIETDDEVSDLAGTIFVPAASAAGLRPGVRFEVIDPVTKIPTDKVTADGDPLVNLTGGQLKYLGMRVAEHPAPTFVGMP